MPTSNPTITADWGKLVDVGEDFTLGFPPGHHQPVAVAAVDTDSAPLVAGRNGPCCKRPWRGVAHLCPLPPIGPR